MIDIEIKLKLANAICLKTSMSFYSHNKYSSTELKHAQSFSTSGIEIWDRVTKDLKHDEAIYNECFMACVHFVCGGVQANAYTCLRACVHA